MSVVASPGVDFDQRRALAEHARARLSGALPDALGDRDASEHGPVRVDPHSLLGRCPRRTANPADDYVDSTATVRRRIGLLALRRAGAAGALQPERPVEVPLARAVSEVVQSREDWSSGLRQWFDGLERAGRVAVEASALTWCSDAVRLVGRDPRIKWSDPFLPARWNTPGRTVQLKGSTDAVIGTPRTGEKLLVITDAVPGPGDRLRAGHVAVVHALGSGRTPVRVSLGSPAAGQVSPVDVDESLVDLVVDRIVEVVGYLADPERAPTVPGRWCSHCHWLDACEDGRTAVPPPRRAS